MKIERYITKFDKNTNELLDELRIDDKISLDKLKKIFRPYKNDPSLFMVYSISLARSIRLKKEIDYSFDFENFIYQLDCYQSLQNKI